MRAFLDQLHYLQTAFPSFQKLNAVLDLGSALPAHFFSLYHQAGFKRLLAVDQASRAALLEAGHWTQTGIWTRDFPEEYACYVDWMLRAGLPGTLDEAAFRQVFRFRFGTSLEDFLSSYKAPEKGQQEGETFGLVMLSEVLHLDGGVTFGGWVLEQLPAVLESHGWVFLKVAAAPGHPYFKHPHRHAFDLSELRAVAQGYSIRLHLLQDDHHYLWLEYEK